MFQTDHYRPISSAIVRLLVAGLLAWPMAATAQLGGLLPASPTVLGNASAAQATILGTTTTLADTGTLSGTTDARDASQLTGSIPSLLGAEVLHATTIGWPDQVASEASLGNLNLTVAGITVSADLVMARALAVLGAVGSGSSNIDNLVINGIPIGITGQPNQTIAIPGGQVVINEQTLSATGSKVNALHITVGNVLTGVADVVIGSATAGIS
jgi:hypothetical protein